MNKIVKESVGCYEFNIDSKNSGKVDLNEIVDKIIENIHDIVDNKTLTFVYDEFPFAEGNREELYKNLNSYILNFVKDCKEYFSVIKISIQKEDNKIRTFICKKELDFYKNFDMKHKTTSINQFVFKE